MDLPASLSRSALSQLDWGGWRLALTVTRREVRDSFRDWRIIVPIFILTLFFPALMNFTAGRLFAFVGQYGAEIVAERVVPFLLLVVGFFPMSFSLVIALETFVGEKERKSLEPLLTTPLTDVQLYVGKVLAAVVPPLAASYVGITVYLVGLWLSLSWRPPATLLVQTFLITTIQGIVMVAGAVVISSQTTSVRASNLLASFIIVPMALLIQAEAIALFYANYGGLWWVIVGLCIIAVVLVRMGVLLFNREELIGRDIDHIRLGSMARRFVDRFLGRTAAGTPGLRTWYGQTLRLTGSLRLPAAASIVAFAGGGVLGLVLARLYPLPAHIQAQMGAFDLADNLSLIQAVQPDLPLLIFGHNLRALALLVLLGMFTFGVMGLLVFMLPWAVIGFACGQLALAGLDPFRFLAATVLPHAWLELPALILISAAALRWQILLIARPPARTISEGWLDAAADFGRVFLALGIPLLALAAIAEAYLTPRVLFALYGAS